MQHEVDEEFAQYVRARQHRLLRAAFLVCGDARLAEDLLQGALAKLAPRWVRLRSEDPDAYLRRVLYRDAIASLRHSHAEALDLHLVEPLAADGSGGLAGFGERIDVERALAQLTPKQRAVLVLRFFEDRTEADAAEVLGVSTRTITSQTHAALTRLRALMPDLATSGGDPS